MEFIYFLIAIGLSIGLLYLILAFIGIFVIVGIGIGILAVVAIILSSIAPTVDPILNTLFTYSLYGIGILIAYRLIKKIFLYFKQRRKLKSDEDQDFYWKDIDDETI